LSAHTDTDPFFDDNMYNHIGIVCDAVKDQTEALQKMTPSKQSLQTIGMYTTLSTCLLLPKLMNLFSGYEEFL